MMMAAHPRYGLPVRLNRCLRECLPIMCTSGPGVERWDLARIGAGGMAEVYRPTAPMTSNSMP